MIDPLRPAKHRQSSPRRNTVILQNLAPGFTLLAPVECYVGRQDSTSHLTARLCKTGVVNCCYSLLLTGDSQPRLVTWLWRRWRKILQDGSKGSNQDGL